MICAKLLADWLVWDWWFKLDSVRPDWDWLDWLMVVRAHMSVVGVVPCSAGCVFGCVTVGSADIEGDWPIEDNCDWASNSTNRVIHI